MTELTGSMPEIKTQSPEESFEERFARMSEECRQEKEQARSEFKRKSARKEIKRSKSKPIDEISIYKARAAAASYRETARVGEGAVRRTVRLIKGLKAVKAEIKSREFMTAEKARAMKTAVWKDAWAPVCNGIGDAFEDLWTFMCDMAGDFWDIILFIVDLLIKIGYYVGSILNYLWDIFWDLRLWLDVHKKSVFQIFSGVVGAVAMLLILINSLSAYEYSYYGRTLGIARSKQDVYKTIEVLGDKLSESSGAKIDLDVEQDIEFKKTFGFGLDVDSSDDILNTLTYMKDIHVEGYAVALDGEPVVYLDSREDAEDLLQQIKDHYTQPKEGVVYTSVTFGQSVTVEEAGIQLGDLWSISEAFNYLVTGSANGTEEGQENPVITVNTVETDTYTEEIEYGIKYIANSSIYKDQVALVTEGKCGVNEITAEVVRVNGVEVSTTIQSCVKTSNPIDAVYYKGTKPIPETIGTGTWIWPIKGKYSISSRFGYRKAPTAGATTYHRGVDIAVSTGTKIYAADGGIVTFSGYQKNTGYMIIIDHGGLYKTKYEHCSKLLVTVGTMVYQGQNIALSGSTGVSTGPHLHFEVDYNNVPIDPLKLEYITQ